MDKYQGRIAYKGDMEPVLMDVCAEFELGSFVGYETVTIGYEDFNLFLDTSKGRYFVKVFADFRSLEDCQRYIDITTAALEAGVSVPKLYSGISGFLFQGEYDGYQFRLSVGEYIHGDNLHRSGYKLTDDEKKFLVHEAAKINQISLRPVPIYDSWAITSLPEEFASNGKYLEGRCKEVIGALSAKISAIDMEKLPHTFVHGDIITTNLVRSNDDGRLYIIDFSVANYYPRIVELAVLFCDLIFVSTGDIEKSSDYSSAIEEYQKIIELTSSELEYLPLFVGAAHAMHVLNAVYHQKVDNDNTEENNHWIELGKKGLGIN